MVVLLALFAALLSTPLRDAAAAEPAEPTMRPNVWLITTDDQPAKTLDFMPFTRAFFARNGARFTDAISPYPLCCPARATLLTGQLSHNHRVLTNRAPYGGFEAFQASGQEDATLPTWLQSAGYRTMFVGKYLNGYRLGSHPAAYLRAGMSGTPPWVRASTTSTTSPSTAAARWSTTATATRPTCSAASDARSSTPP